MLGLLSNEINLLHVRHGIEDNLNTQKSKQTKQNQNNQSLKQKVYESFK